MKTLVLLWLAAAFTLTFAPAQNKQKPGKADQAVKAAGRQDPYTKGNPQLMKAAGIVRYGPFPWCDFKTTDDIEVELGKGRFLWMETEHFRIGCNLRTASWPQQQDKRKFLKAEIKALRKQLSKLPAKPRRLGPWVRLHLYAYRLEKLYADVQELMGVTDADFGSAKMPPNGPYLGMGDKYLVLLFQKTSDLSRYLDFFCDFKAETSMRWYHDKTFQMLCSIAVESLEGFDAAAVHAHVVYNVAHSLFSGYRGNHVKMPLWLEEGLAHHFALKVPSPAANVQILDNESGPGARLNDWPIKVRRRAQHEGVSFTYEQMAAWTELREMGYHAHSQAWSRVDYLLHRDHEKVALMVEQLKAIPPMANSLVPHGHVAATTQKCLTELFELDPQTFDQKWRAWVLKTYPKK